MKKILTLILLPLIGLVGLNAQNARQMVRQTVFSQEIYKNWNIDEVKEVNGVKVTRNGDANGINDRTNILYLPSKGVDDPKLALFYDRNDEELAQPDHFEVTVRNSDGNILYFKQLHEMPEYYKWDIWYNYVEIPLPFLPQYDLFVEVEDKAQDKIFSFYIYDIPPDAMKPDLATITEQGE